jgi:hypothetical protein
MAKVIWTATCASIVGVATAALIAQAAASQETPSARQTVPSRVQHVIVTGCLSVAPAKADANRGTAGTSGTAGAAAPKGTVGTAGTEHTTDDGATDPAATLPIFVVTLASVSPADAPNGESSGEQHTSAAAPRTYRVVGNHALLIQHVGEQVEVTGTLEEPKAAAASTANGARGSQANLPIVHLESGKTLTSVCGPGA